MRCTKFLPAAAAVPMAQLLRPAAASRPRLKAGLLLPFRHHRGLLYGAAVDIEALRASMAARPAKAIYDVLSPVPSHLLNISLSDYIPPECGASPGSPFDRRMWAGGSVRFDGFESLVLDGRRAVCVERLGHIKASGSPGAEKIFVDVWRRYGLVDPAAADPEAAVEASPAVEERRTLVFIRDVLLPPSSATSSSRPPSRVVKLPFEPDYAFSLTPSATLLFHFSALTYNAHAIHLNPQYCREVEGHRNLLFHGPLSLVLMLSILRSQLSDPAAIKSLEYRNLAPLYADEPLRVCIRKNNHGSATDTNRWDVWVEGPEGGLAVRGSAITA
ncbi:hypothetical protein CMQ_2971 [Grosmannia clavigera kw1407]|uniref:Uncharacterized protein n=1 Tax=Grosmannia clavigera (strain kw1407 / UAMH 11150) TaxID=655863 RepID=F0XHL7_GROCL|nr:uncharacterized protein CMQ_2971 [Grosmannia clavigera kw1407]EFX03042.1 hypothetical protein CMQ_2971 [Grosmannia clavigera kw1407]